MHSTGFSIWGVLAGFALTLLTGFIGYWFSGRNRAENRKFQDQLQAIELHIKAFREVEFACSQVNFRLQPRNGPPAVSYALKACDKLIETYNNSLDVRHRLPREIVAAMSPLEDEMRIILAMVAAEQCQPEGMQKIPNDLRTRFDKIILPTQAARRVLEREYQWMVWMRREPWYKLWQEHAPLDRT